MSKCPFLSDRLRGRDITPYAAEPDRPCGCAISTAPGPFCRHDWDSGSNHDECPERWQEEARVAKACFALLKAEVEGIAACCVDCAILATRADPPNSKAEIYKRIAQDLLKALEGVEGEAK